MRLSKIIDRLKTLESFEILQQQDDCDITEFRFVSPEESFDNSDILYIGVMPNAQEIQHAITLLSYDKNLCLPKGSNILYLSSDDFSSSFNLITDCFMESQKNEIAFGHIMSLLIHHASLHDAINQAALFLNRSLILTDLSFKVIDYSTAIPVTDSLWLSNIERGFCTGTFISAINELLPTDKIPLDGTPFLVNCSASPERKLCTRLSYEGQYIGYLILLDNEKGLLDYHYEYLARIGTLMVEFMKKHPTFRAYIVDIASNILISLLDGEDPEMSRQRLLASGITFPPNMYCLLFLPDSSSKHIQAYLESNLKSQFPSGQFFSYGFFIVALMSTASLETLQKMDPASYIMTHIREIGVSSIFSNILQLPTMFREAAKSCSLAHRLDKRKKICMYEEFRFFDLLSTCSDAEFLSNCIHPAFEVLNSYDINKKTALLETLETYILNNMNAKETATALFLHRNTLKYRLDKIQKLTGLDYSDPETRFQLALSIRVNMLLKIY